MKLPAARLEARAGATIQAVQFFRGAGDTTRTRACGFRLSNFLRAQTTAPTITAAISRIWGGSSRMGEKSRVVQVVDLLLLLPAWAGRLLDRARGGKYKEKRREERRTSRERTSWSRL